MFRKTVGLVSVIGLTIVMLAYSKLFLQPLVPRPEFNLNTVLVALFLIWFFLSFINKLSMVRGVFDNWAAIGSIILGIVTTTFYLVAVNIPDKTMITGVLIPAALAFLWLVDFVDLAIQKTCKA